MSNPSAFFPCRPAAILAAILFCALPAKATDLLIFAAASTTDILNEALADYQKTSPNRVRASFASSGALARQIDAGAPAHLFLSANRKWVRWLEGRSKTAFGRRTQILANRLALVAPIDSKLSLKIEPGFPLAASLGDGRLAIADPAHVPAGQYAAEALKNLGVWDGIAPRAARASSVRAALALVERGEAPAGIVYRTDAIRSKQVRILDIFPSDSNTRIAYTLALVGKGEDEAAISLFSYLLSRQARAIYERFGFEVLIP